MGSMKGITIKLPAATLKRLRAEARATGRSVAELVRERLESPVAEDRDSVHGITADLAGSLAGGRRAATNDRRRFGRS